MALTITSGTTTVMLNGYTIATKVADYQYQSIVRDPRNVLTAAELETVRAEASEALMDAWTKHVRQIQGQEFDGQDGYCAAGWIARDEALGQQVCRRWLPEPRRCEHGGCEHLSMTLGQHIIHLNDYHQDTFLDIARKL